MTDIIIPFQNKFYVERISATPNPVPKDARLERNEKRLTGILNAWFADQGRCDPSPSFHISAVSDGFAQTLVKKAKGANFYVTNEDIEDSDGYRIDQKVTIYQVKPKCDPKYDIY